jgi:O-antigen/teichoic acid export membrane protein
MSVAESSGVEATAASAAPSLARRLFGGIGAITTAGAAVRMLGVLSAPLLTRALGPVPYGDAALVATMTALMSTVALLGIDLAYSRYFFGGVDAEPGAVERFCWKFGLASGALVSAAGAVLWVLLIAPRSGSGRGLGVLVATGGMFGVLAAMAQVRARLRGEYTRLAGAIAASGVAATAATLALALWWRSDAWSLVLGAVLASAVLTLMSGVPRPGDLLRASGLSARQRSAVLRLGLPGAGTALMYWVLSSADRFVIQAYLPTSALGTYSFSAGLSMMGLMLNSSIVMVWIPEASRSYEGDRANAPAVLGRLWSRLVVLLAVAWLAVAMAGGDLIRLLADPRFAEGARYVPWLAGAVFFYGLAALASTGLILSGTMVMVTVWWVAGIGVSATLNLTLVPRMGAIAAAVAMCSAFAVIAVGVMWSSQRWLPMRIRWGVLVAVLAGILAAGVAGSPAWLGDPMSSLLLKLPVGIAAAAAAVRVIAPDWFARGAARAAAALHLPRS